MDRMEARQKAVALSEQTEARRAFRQWAGRLKARTQIYSDKIEKGVRAEFWSGALMAMKQSLNEL
jgi:hypothetical protein